MRTRQWIQIAAVAAAVGMTGTAIADDNNHMKMNGSAATNPGARDANGREIATDSDLTAPSQNLDTWMNGYATAHNGRITREEFMGQMSHRWDRLDAQRQGYLTPDQARGIYMGGEKGK